MRTYTFIEIYEDIMKASWSFDMAFCTQFTIFRAIMKRSSTYTWFCVKIYFHIFYNNLTLNGFQTLLDSILYSTVSWEYMEKLGHKVNRFMGYDIRLCRAIWSNIVEAIRILMNYALRLYRIKVLLHIQICCLYVVAENDDVLLGCS